MRRCHQQQIKNSFFQKFVKAFDIVEGLLTKTSAEATGCVLRLATFGGVTQIGPFQFVSHHPRWPRQVQ
jgi:hypothetical protein